ncbi:MAG: ABC transporter permease [Thermoleophilia bacterium]|nr:ABC transporter permease [Thermoleophilia bacterium]
MKRFRATYIIWLRDLKRHFRDRARIFGSLATPIIFIFILGQGLGSSMSAALPAGSTTLDYKTFMFPGILGMTVLFAGVFSAVSIVWDREFGFLKEMLVAPVPSWSIALGKVVSGATIASFQGCLMLILAPLAGVKLTPQMVVLLIPTLFLVAFSMTGMGVLVASRLKSMQGFQMIMNFIMMPMFFLSGAMFPLANAPAWMDTLAKINPLTYGVDALRSIMLTDFPSRYPFAFDITMIVLISSVMLGMAIATFSRQS